MTSKKEKEKDSKVCEVSIELSTENVIRELSELFGKEVAVGYVDEEKESKESSVAKRSLSRDKAKEDIMNCIGKMESGVLMLKTWMIFEKMKESLVNINVSYISVDFFLLFISKPTNYDFSFYTKDGKKVVSAECLTQIQECFCDLDELYGKVNTDNCLRKSINNELSELFWSNKKEKEKDVKLSWFNSSQPPGGEEPYMEEELIIDFETLNRFHKELNVESFHALEQAVLNQKITNSNISKCGLRL